MVILLSTLYVTILSVIYGPSACLSLKLLSYPRTLYSKSLGGSTLIIKNGKANQTWARRWFLSVADVNKVFIVADANKAEIALWEWARTRRSRTSTEPTQFRYLAAHCFGASSQVRLGVNLLWNTQQRHSPRTPKYFTPDSSALLCAP